jgi:hypothetical protein
MLSPVSFPKRCRNGRENIQERVNTVLCVADIQILNAAGVDALLTAAA